jgi:hypothetical protein
MKKFSLLFIILIVSIASAAPPSLKIPAEIKPSGQYAELLPETDAVSVTYVGQSGIEPIPARWLSDKRVFLLDTRGLSAGRYKFAAVAASKDGEQARADFVLVIGDAPPDVPPGPPSPPTALGKALQDAYARETDPKKASYLAWMQSIYRVSGMAVETSDTYADLFSRISNSLHVENVGYPKGSMKLMSEAIGSHLEATVGIFDKIKADKVDKAKAKAAFAEISKALDGVK